MKLIDKEREALSSGGGRGQREGGGTAQGAFKEAMRREPPEWRQRSQGGRARPGIPQGGSGLHGEDIRQPRGRFEPGRDLVPGTAWEGGGVVIGERGAGPGQDESGKFGIELRGN